MKLRIVAGVLGRRVITVERSAQEFRPTQERIRQAAAETLKPRIPGARAADLCAGSGAFGIELVSRGAASVDFVEDNPARARSILKQCEAFGIGRQCRVVTQDVRGFLDACAGRAGSGGYDIVFYDPPYNEPALAALVPALCGLLAAGGVLVYERAKSGTPQGELLGGSGYDVETRTYGDTAVEFIKKEREASSE
jgi:16S rRNA (guanine966-N2)-methyltransferase